MAAPAKGVRSVTETKSNDDKAMNELLKRSDRVSETYRAHLRELLRHGWSQFEFKLGEFQVSWTGDMKEFKELSMFLLMMTDKINTHLEKMPEVEDAYESKTNGPNDPAIK